MNRSVSRRRFLALSAGAAASGVEGIVAARRAPAYAQGTRLHLLQWSHFIPAADTLFEAQAAEFGKQAGVEVKIERINQNDLQARATASIQSGAGPDIIILANNHAHLYETSLVDVSDVAEEIGGKQGGWYDYAKVNCVAGGRWIGVPQFIVSWAITYREDWFKEAGFEYPKTWDDFRKVGRALKAKAGRSGRRSVTASTTRTTGAIRWCGCGAAWRCGRTAAASCSTARTRSTR
jgi:multiple sugar transport system substrate-binding protein